MFFLKLSTCLFNNQYFFPVWGYGVYCFFYAVVPKLSHVLYLADDLKFGEVHSNGLNKYQ